MSDLSNVEVIAIDILKNNSFMTIINALSSKNLNSLYIKDNVNAVIFSNLNDSEKTKLFSILHRICEQKA